MDYNPDKWVLLKIQSSNQTIYKVLAGWSESYLYGASWKLNSGCTSCTDRGEHFEFKGSSGNVYHCYKGAYGLTMLTAGILSQLQELAKGKGTFELMPEGTDFLGLNYE